MNGFAQLVTDFQAYQQACGDFFKGWQPQSVTPVEVTTKQRQLSQPELLDALYALDEVQGWVLQTDKRLSLQQQKIEPLSAAVLAADLFDGQQSIKVRLLKEGLWLWVSTEIKTGDDATHLAVPVFHVATEKGLGKLAYQQLWCRNEQGRLHVEDAVFVGFKGE